MYNIKMQIRNDVMKEISKQLA